MYILPHINIYIYIYIYIYIHIHIYNIKCKILTFVKHCSIHRSIAIYIYCGRKKTNKLQVHPCFCGGWKTRVHYVCLRFSVSLGVALVMASPSSR